MASSKKIGRNVEESVNKALSNIGSMKPDMKGGDTELKSAVAPQKAPSFAEAFREARKDPEAMKRGTFTWGGKSYTTKMAGEGPKRSTPASTSTKKAETPTTNTRAQVEMRRTAARSQAAIREQRAENQADFRKRTQAKPNTSTPAKPAAAAKQDYASKYEARAAEKAKQEKATGSAGARARLKDLFGFGAAGDRRAAAAAREMAARKPTSRPLLLTGDAAREANRKQGTIGGKAKGGKIDGIAIRGKTRAPLKKGK